MFFGIPPWIHAKTSYSLRLRPRNPDSSRDNHGAGVPEFVVYAGAGDGARRQRRIPFCLTTTRTTIEILMFMFYQKQEPSQESKLWSVQQPIKIKAVIINSCSDACCSQTEWIWNWLKSVFWPTSALSHITIVWPWVGSTTISFLMITLVHTQNMWVAMQFGNVQSHAATIFIVWASSLNSLPAAQDFGQVFKQPFHCLIIQNRQAVQTTGCSGAEAVNPDSHCSWQGHARRVGANVGDEVTESAVFFKHSAFHRLSAQRATLLLLSWD